MYERLISIKYPRFPQGEHTLLPINFFIYKSTFNLKIIAVFHFYFPY